ncbi:hypothetical protein VTO73DRAFT_13825 [Trametes versicolor]
MVDTDTSATERRFIMPRRDAVAQARRVGGGAAAMSPLSDPQDASPKRTSSHLGDLQTPSPSPKRARHESRAPSGANESVGSAARRAAGASIDMKSTNFWYADGNVVIKAESTYYKLYRLRLAQYCVYFQKLFADETEGYNDRYATVENCPVYHLPAELVSGDFESLLAALETPLAFTDGPPTQTVACALLRAAHSLSCAVVYKLAKARLCALWDASRPPTAPSHLATLFPTAAAPASSPTGTDSNGQRSYENAVFIIRFARQYGVPELLKRAFYELFTSAAFWAVLAGDRKQIRLTEDDLLRLYNARFVLQQRWREALVVAPYTNKQGVSACRVDVHGRGYVCRSSRYEPAAERPQRWRSMMLESGLVEAGTADPMRFDVLGALSEEQRQPWCRGCLKGWGDMLMEKRMEWWVMFANLMQLM